MILLIPLILVVSTVAGLLIGINLNFIFVLSASICSVVISRFVNGRFKLNPQGGEILMGMCWLFFNATMWGSFIVMEVIRTCRK